MAASMKPTGAELDHVTDPDPLFRGIPAPHGVAPQLRCLAGRAGDLDRPVEVPAELQVVALGVGRRAVRLLAAPAVPGEVAQPAEPRDRGSAPCRRSRRERSARSTVWSGA